MQLSNTSLFAQKQIAITIDDPNTYNNPVLDWQARNEKIISTLDKYGVEAALYVCGMRVNDENGINLLNSWDKNGHLICNPSYSHLYASRGFVLRRTGKRLI